MKDTMFYEQLLGLKSPWSVKKVDLSMADKRVTVEVEKTGEVCRVMVVCDDGMCVMVTAPPLVMRLADR